MPTTKKFNGTTLLFDSQPLGTIQSLNASEGGEALEVGGAADDEHLYEAGIPDCEVNVTVKGTGAAARGDTGALAITWKSGGTEGSGTLFVCTKADKKGDHGGIITTDYTFKPAAGS